MSEIIKYEDVRDSIITIRGQQVILDADVARLYGVETKRVNEAVKNNPEKFPEGFLIQLNLSEKQELIKNFDHLQSLKFSPVNPTAFTESGLYMLATDSQEPACYPNHISYYTCVCATARIGANNARGDQS